LLQLYTLFQRKNIVVITKEDNYTSFIYRINYLKSCLGEKDKIITIIKILCRINAQNWTNYFVIVTTLRDCFKGNDIVVITKEETTIQDNNILYIELIYI